MPLLPADKDEPYMRRLGREKLNVLVMPLLPPALRPKAENPSHDPKKRLDLMADTALGAARSTTSVLLTQLSVRA